MKRKAAAVAVIAGITSINAALASDLPAEKGSAVEYVKVCSQFGKGFFYLPGSDTCLKIGGDMRASYRVYGGTGFGRNDDRSAFNAQMRLSFDARTQTDYGVLRSYVETWMDSHPISQQGRGGSYNPNSFVLWRAFIQYGGLTAGYAHSFFGFYDAEYGYSVFANYFANNARSNLIAYTAELGNGFLATVSIEDGRDHRQMSTLTSGGQLPIKQGGQRLPDLVGQLRYTQDWGSFAVQAAAHEFRTAEDVTPRQSKFGWAAGATALINIPAIKGYLIIEGQYADGALNYLGGNLTWLAQSDYFRTNSGQIRSGKGWSVTAELSARLTPSLNLDLIASYYDAEYDGVFANTASLGNSDLILTSSLVYSVTKDLSITPMISYETGRVSGGKIASGPTKGFDHYNLWFGGLRIKRTF